MHLEHLSCKNYRKININIETLKFFESQDNERKKKQSTFASAVSIQWEGQRMKYNNIALDSLVFIFSGIVLNRSHFVHGLLFQIYNIQLITIIMVGMHLRLLRFEYFRFIFIVFRLKFFFLTSFALSLHILFFPVQKDTQWQYFPIDCDFDTLHSYFRSWMVQQ